MLPLQNKSMHYSKASRNSTISPWHCAYKISRSRPIFMAVWTPGQMRRNLPTAEPCNKPPGRARATVMTRPQQGHSKAAAGPQRDYSPAQPFHSVATPWPSRATAWLHPGRNANHRYGLSRAGSASTGQAQPGNSQGIAQEAAWPGLVTARHRTDSLHMA